MTTETEALLPCPFCGGENIVVHENDWCEPPEWCVTCGQCCSVPSHTIREQAVAAWNRRAIPPLAPAPEGLLCEIHAAVEAWVETGLLPSDLVGGYRPNGGEMVKFSLTDWRSRAAEAIAARNVRALSRRPSPAGDDVERVARAILDHRLWPGAYDAAKRNDPSRSDLGRQEAEQAEDEARAAIAALAAAPGRVVERIVGEGLGHWPRPEYVTAIAGRLEARADNEPSCAELMRTAADLLKRFSTAPPPEGELAPVGWRENAAHIQEKE